MVGVLMYVSKAWNERNDEVIKEKSNSCNNPTKNQKSKTNLAKSSTEALKSYCIIVVIRVCFILMLNMKL